MVAVILVIDAGSSSIRCTGYEYHGGDIYTFEGPFNREERPPTTPTPPVTLMEGINHTIKMSAIVPCTGNIRIFELLSAIDECIDEVLKLLRANHAGFRLAAVGFSTFVMNLIGVDKFGDPVGDLATCSYACNREDVVKACEKLKVELGTERLYAMYQRTGTPMHSAYAVPQLRAFYSNEENQPMIKKIEKWKSITSICIFRWTGKPHLQIPISYSEASWTGMFDFRKCGWDDEAGNLLDGCVAPRKFDEEDEFEEEVDLLPPIVDYDADLPFFRTGIPRYCADGEPNIYFDKWPEFRDSFSLFLGVGDGAAANVGSKCGGFTLNGRIAVTIGTSAAARVCLPIPPEREDSISPYTGKPYEPFISSGLPHRFSIPQGLFAYRIDRFRVLVGGALTDGGSAVDWARSVFNLQSPDAFNTCMSKVTKMYYERCSVARESPAQPVPENITMVPFLSGERSTGFRTGANACVSGITRETRAEHIVYACLESVVLRLCHVLELLNQVPWRPEDGEDKPSQRVLVASGNALEKNSLWQHMLADCSSMDVIVDKDCSEGTSRGVAMMIAGSMHNRPSYWHQRPLLVEEPLVVAQEAKSKSTLPTVHAHWVSAMTSQNNLIGAVAPTWHEA